MSDRFYSVRCHGQLSWPASRCRHWTRVPLHLVMSTTNRCRYCAAVEGAIMQLNDLIAEQPWWETEGRVGDPDYEQAEADRAEVVARLLDDLSAGREDEEEEERTYEGGLTAGLLQELLQRDGVDLRNRLVLSFINTAGQGLAEAEVYGLPAATATTTAVEEEEDEEEGESDNEASDDDDDDDDDDLFSA